MERKSKETYKKRTKQKNERRNKGKIFSLLLSSSFIPLISLFFLAKLMKTTVDESKFPCLDLLRILVLHPFVANHFTKNSTFI